MEKAFEFVKAHKKEVILFGSGFILCVAIVMITTCYNTYKENKKLEKQIELIEKKEAKKKKETKKKEEESSNIEDVEIVENNTNPEPVAREVSSVVDDNYTNNIKASDEEVVSYFREYETMSSSSNPSVKDKLKNGVNTIYSFLFEDGTIKGKTFKELTNAAKLQVLKITLSIDNKIDYYFPGYKDRIKEDSRNLKEKVVTKYLETTNKICSNHEDICNYAREDFKTMKNSFSITWSLIKEVARESTTALKEWYQSI